MLKAVGSVLKNPFTVLLFAGLGLYVGAAYPEFAEVIAPFGSIFLAMLQMVALPIILCAVISGLGSLLYSGVAGKTMSRFALLLVLGPICAAALSLITGIIVEPGKNLPDGAESVFGTMIGENKEATGGGTDDSGIWVFANQVVPDNIFVSLVDGKSLQVLFFSILVGIALGQDRRKSNQVTLDIIEAIFDSLLKIINWLVYLLPFGLFALLAAQVENINMTAMLAMLKLAVVYVGTCLLLFSICVAIIRARTGASVTSILHALRESILISAGSSNSFAALPSALRGLQNELGLSRRITDLVTPLALNLLPLGTIIYFSVATLFIAQISGVDLSVSEYTILFFGSILAGLAAASLPSAAGISVIAIVLEPLGLPVEVAVVLLIAIDPLLEPVNAATDTFAACTASCVISEPPGGGDVSGSELVSEV